MAFGQSTPVCRSEPQANHCMAAHSFSGSGSAAFGKLLADMWPCYGLFVTQIWQIGVQGQSFSAIYGLDEYVWYGPDLAFSNFAILDRFRKTLWVKITMILLFIPLQTYLQQHATNTHWGCNKPILTRHVWQLSWWGQALQYSLFSP